MKRSILGLSLTLLAPLSLSAEPPQASDIFNKLDTNQDGVLVESEISAEKRRFLTRVLEKGDTNEDGKLTEEEFTVAFKPKADGERPKRPEGAPGKRPAGDGAFFDRLDKDKDGKITEKDLADLPEQAKARLGEMIKKADKNGDGVTKDELAAAFRERAGDAKPGEGRPKKPEAAARKPGDFAEAMFNRMDKDGNGKVTADELPEEAKARFEKMLENADENKDQAISKEEFLAGMKKLREARPEGRPAGNPQEFMKRLIDRMDTNKNEAVDRSEAKGRLAENFDKLDTNKDDKVTAEELAAGMKRAAGEGRPNKKPEGKKPEGKPEAKKPEAKPESDN